MNEFRQALDGYLAGRCDLKAVERELNLSLARQPQLAAAHGAYVEALYRGGRIAGEIYLTLVRVIRTVQQAQTQSAAARAAAAPAPAVPAAGPAAAPSAADSAPEGAESDKTQFRAPAPPSQRPAAADAGGDKTQFRPPRPVPSAAASAPSSPAPEVVRPQLVSAVTDPSWSQTSGPNTGSTTGGTRATSSSTWGDAMRWNTADAVLLGPGSVVKERFVLEDELGRGGMGIVFKARDVRKEEAQDRNPYVALKILNEEFKRHPESLKALQREARKAQSLAHPNVVTVYDFDRDGANVYMVMELLEGEALDRLIRRSKGSGVELKEALRITRDICRAMAYAHERGVVHSDFKPANAFLTREGVVKVFDFGIARAAKRADKVTGTMTLFDPSTLGALTPAYASCEMIEGLEPDPRDDVYAIACVAYELLMGKHPFDRMSAVQARDAKLVPKQPPGVSRAQWRALQRGLAFSREARSTSAIDFLNGILPPKRAPTVYIGVGAAAVAAVVIGAVIIPGQISKYREQRRITALATGRRTDIEPLLPSLRSMSPSERNTILANEEARGGLIRYFEEQLSAATDTAKGHFDFPRAEALATELRAFYPDSAAVKDISDRLLARKNDEIKRQSDRLDAALARGELTAAQGPDNVEAVLASVRSIDAHHPLLHDPRLPGAYAQQSRMALQRSNFSLAQTLVESGLRLQPEDPALRDLRDETRSASRSAQQAARVAALERSLSTLLTARASLADFDARRTEIGELRSMDSQSAALARVQESLDRDLDRELQSLVAAHKPDAAQKLLTQYADIAAPVFVEGKRQQLISARSAYESKLAAISDALTQAIRDKRLGSSVRGSAEQHLEELASAGADATAVSSARDQIAQGYAHLASEARQHNEWGQARSLVAAGAALHPSTAAAGILQQVSHEVDDSERLAKVQLDAEQRRQLTAQREREDNDLRTQLVTGLRQSDVSIEDARRLGAVADRLVDRGAKDALVINAKRDLQERLARAASALKDSKGIDDAVKFAEQASGLFPDSQLLRQTVDSLRLASTQRLAQQRDASVAEIKGRIVSLLKSPKSEDSWDTSLKRELQKLGGYLQPSDPYFTQVKMAASAAYLSEERTLRQAQRLAEAGRMLERAREYAPQSPDLSAEDKLLADAKARQSADSQARERLAQVEALKQKLIDQAQANEVTEAQASLVMLRTKLPTGDSFTSKDAPEAIGRSFLRLASSAAKEGRFENAVSLVDRGRDVAPTVSDLGAARQRYSRYIALDHALASDQSPDIGSIRRELEQLSKLDASEAALVKQRFARTLVSRIRVAANDRTAAGSVLTDRLTRDARDLFPNDPGVTALQGGTVAARSQQQQVASTAQPSGTNAIGGPTGPASAAGAAGTAETSKADAAVALASSRTPAAQAGSAIGPQGSAQIVPSGAPCTASLAGYGRRKQGVCFDAFEGGRGPDMVVVPASSSGGQVFAIGRAEVSNADYATYCSKSGRCPAPGGSPNNPLTSISIQDAQRYIDWLSQVTGATYRLPTDAEWTYAATAQGGTQDRSSINCVLEFGGKQVRGFTLDSVLSGSPNSWGLYNYAGNAQEWVRTGSSITARGGAYTDNASQCTPATSRPHSGSADPITGFRVLREIK